MPQTLREYFYYIGFARDNFKHVVSLVHVPHLEDYRANFSDEFKVRKRFWSRLKVSQINMFEVILCINGIKEDESEEVIGPFYVNQIECMPIPKIDWSRREEDDFLSYTSEVLKRTKNWLKSNTIKSATLGAPEKYSRAKHKKTHPKPKVITNPSINDPVVGSPKVEVEENL